MRFSLFHMYILIFFVKVALFHNSKKIFLKSASFEVFGSIYTCGQQCQIKILNLKEIKNEQN